MPAPGKRSEEAIRKGGDRTPNANCRPRRPHPFFGGLLGSGVLAAAALAPPVVWLFPALFRRLAPSFRDQGDFFFPLKLYTADRLRHGSIPLWNPLSGCGEPWLANLQSGVFYPPTLLFLIPSPALSAALFLLLHFGIAVWGTWRFCKDEGVSDAGALLAALVFAASGFPASLSAYWNHFGAYAYLPAIAALARSGPATRRSAAGLAALVGLQAMAGSPELTAITIAIAFVLALRPREPFPAADGWRRPDPSRLRRRWLAATALGLALAAWALVPFGELALHSARRAPLPRAERELGAVRADAAGSALGISESSNFFVGSLFVGAVPVVAALGAFFERERRRIVLPIAAVGVVGLALAAASPPGEWLRSVPGLDRVRYPAKALAASLFALSLLAGFGLDAFRFSSERRRRILLALAAAAGAALAVFVRQPAAVRATTGAAAVGLAALALAPRSRTAAGGALAGGVALAAAAGLAIACRPLFRFAPEAEIRRRPEPIEFLSAVPGRTLTPPMEALVPWAMGDAAFDASALRRQRESLLGYTNLLEGVRTLRTAAALPTRGADAIAAEVDVAPDPARAAGPATGRVYWTPFPPPGLGSRRVDGFYRAPLNPYRPRVSFAAAFRLESDPERAWRRVARRESDWSREVQLDREPSPRPDAPSRYVLARIAEEEPERVVASVTSEGAGLVVLTDLAYPGWRATVDGRPAPVLTADGVFRAVAVPPGSHRVEFVYRPMSFYAGSAVSVLALLAVLAWARRGPGVSESAP